MCSLHQRCDNSQNRETTCIITLLCMYLKFDVGKIDLLNLNFFVSGLTPPDLPEGTVTMTTPTTTTPTTTTTKDTTEKNSSTMIGFAWINLMVMISLLVVTSLSNFF